MLWSLAGVLQHDSCVPGGRKNQKKSGVSAPLCVPICKIVYSAQQHPAPSAKIKVKIRFAGDDHLFFLPVIHILPSALCQHCFRESRSLALEKLLAVLTLFV